MAAPDVSLDYSLTSDGANNAGPWTPEIVDVTAPGLTVDAIDNSTQETTVVRTKQAADLAEPGELTLEIQFDEADRPVVGAANEAWTLVFPDDTTWVFQGFVSSYEPGSHTLNGIMMATATIQVSGAITG